MSSEAARRVGLPPKPFLYTLDQVSFLLDISQEQLKRAYLHYEGRSVGIAGKNKIIARNIAPAGEKPEWRIAEREFVRWLRFKGFRYHERGYIDERDRRRE